MIILLIPMGIVFCLLLLFAWVLIFEDEATTGGLCVISLAVAMGLLAYWILDEYNSKDDLVAKPLIAEYLEEEFDAEILNISSWSVEYAQGEYDIRKSGSSDIVHRCTVEFERINDNTGVNIVALDCTALEAKIESIASLQGDAN